jgi:hypothetical protein
LKFLSSCPHALGQPGAGLHNPSGWKRLPGVSEFPDEAEGMPKYVGLDGIDSRGSALDLAHRKPPLKAIQEHWHVSRPAAAKYVKGSRERVSSAGRNAQDSPVTTRPKARLRSRAGQPVDRANVA